MLLERLDLALRGGNLAHQFFGIPRNLGAFGSGLGPITPDGNETDEIQTGICPVASPGVSNGARNIHDTTHYGNGRSSQPTRFFRDFCIALVQHVQITTGQFKLARVRNIDEIIKMLAH